MAKTVLPDARVSPRFAGLVTFGRYPRLADVTPASRPVDWAIYGVPFDAGVTYRPGARFGPRAIRDASQYLKRFHMEHGVDVCAVLSLADAGDCPVQTYSCEATRDAQAAFARGLLDSGVGKLIALGGDHSIAYANMRCAWERSGGREGLSLIHFDSHLDTVDRLWGESWGHASVFRRAIEDGIVDPKAMISIGIKGPLNSGDDLQYGRERGVTIITCEQYRASGPALLRDFLPRIAGRAAYVTFDIDCVDPAYAPGTGTPSIGGFTSAEVLDAIRLLKGIRLAGADVVEVLPDLDPTGITSLLAAHVVFEIIALDAASR